MKNTLAGFVIALVATPFSQAGVIVHDTWSGNVTADYQVTIDDDTAGLFTVRIVVDPAYQADVLAFGFDNGDRYNSAADIGFGAVDPDASSYAPGYPQFYFDTASCGPGCNWSGIVSAFDTIILLQPVGAANGIWEDITFTITRLAGDDLDLFGIVGLRAQSVGLEPCDEDECGDSDKAYAALSPPTAVPEPGSLPLLLTGTAAFLLLRHRAAARPGQAAST